VNCNNQEARGRQLWCTVGIVSVHFLKARKSAPKRSRQVLDIETFKELPYYPPSPEQMLSSAP